MAAEKRKWYRGMMIGEGIYLFAIPMSDTESNIFFDVLSRARCVYDGGYSPCIDIDVNGYKTPDDFGKPDFDWWEDFGDSKIISIGRNDYPASFKEDKRDDTQ